MTKQCDCYRTRMTGMLQEESYCIGTKERERCTCNGDESKCNFYPEKAAKGKHPMIRLTKRTPWGGLVLNCEYCPKFKNGCYGLEDCVLVLAERLAAYEDREGAKEDDND